MPFQDSRQTSRACQQGALSIRVVRKPCPCASNKNPRRRISVRNGQLAAGAQPKRDRMPMTEPVLEVRGLQKYFPVSTGNPLHRKLAWVKAVETVDFTIHPGETLGLIGESGCGKTTTAKL